MKTRILFLSRYNSCRSQIAEGLISHDLGDLFSACSAGSEFTCLNPKAVAVMAENGIDISNQYSKDADDFSDQEFDYVVSLVESAQEKCHVRGAVSYCGRCAAICPHLEKTSHGGKRVFLEGFPDPALAAGNEEEVLTSFRTARDAIKAALLELFG